MQPILTNVMADVHAAELHEHAAQDRQSADQSAPDPTHVALAPLSVDTWGMRSRLTSSHFVGRVGELR